MKLSLKTICITLFALFLIFPIASAEETAPADTAVGIRQLINGTDHNTDNVIVRGFVSKVSPQDKLISLIDHPDVKSGHKSMGKQCPMKAAMDSGKGCPMGAAKTVEKSCPMTGKKASAQADSDGVSEKCDKACTKPCSASSAAECTKTCPKASGKECAEKCTKTCPKTADQNTVQDTDKGCPMMAEKSCKKPCSENSARDITQSCPMKAAKTSCGAAGKTPTLSVKWEGNMPETATFVEVHGKMTQKDGEMLFVAESIETMSN
jgi:hypothetical protein